MPTRPLLEHSSCRPSLSARCAHACLYLPSLAQRLRIRNRRKLFLRFKVTNPTIFAKYAANLTNVHKVAPVPCSKWRIAFSETPHLSDNTCCDILACKRCEAILAPINFKMSCLVPFTITTILFRVADCIYYTITVLKRFERFEEFEKFERLERLHFLQTRR